MTLDKLDYVLTLAEERNMRRAAAKLYISQPGLTAYINKLEQYLGVKLFDRTVTPIQVTEAGALYISRMKELRQSETMLRSQLAELGNRRRTLRIGIGVTRGSLWLPYLLPTFQKNAPGGLCPHSGKRHSGSGKRCGQRHHRCGLRSPEFGVSRAGLRIFAGRTDLLRGLCHLRQPGLSRVLIQ